MVDLLPLSPYNQTRLVSHVGFLLGRLANELLHVFLSVLVLVDIGAAVQWCPLGVLLEQSHGMDELEISQSVLHNIYVVKRLFGLTLLSSVVKRW